MRKIQQSHPDQYDRWENTTKVMDIAYSAYGLFKIFYDGKYCDQCDEKTKFLCLPGYNKSTIFLDHPVLEFILFWSQYTFVSQVRSTDDLYLCGIERKKVTKDNHKR